MKILLALTLLASGCAPARADEAECAHAADAPAAGATMSSLVLRGEKVPEGPALKVADLVSGNFDGQTVVVEGQVRRACSRKGCWMELASAEKSAGVRVTFKDYGFFVPTDSAGASARVQGVVKVATLTPELAHHYESEGATVPRDAQGQPREVQLVATGVELHR